MRSEYRASAGGGHAATVAVAVAVLSHSTSFNSVSFMIHIISVMSSTYLSKDNTQAHTALYHQAIKHDNQIQ